MKTFNSVFHIVFIVSLSAQQTPLAWTMYQLNNNNSGLPQLAQLDKQIFLGSESSSEQMFHGTVAPWNFHSTCRMFVPVNKNVW